MADDRQEQNARILEEHIRTMQKQMQINQIQLQQQSQQLNQKMQAEVNSAVRHFQENYQKQEADYRQAFSKSVSSLEHEHEHEIQKLRKEYAALEKQQEKLEQCLKREQEQLAQVLSEIRQEFNSVQKTAGAEAYDALRRLETNCRKASALPVESFYPHKLQIYQNAVVRCAELINQKLYTAAIGVSESAFLGTERLTADTTRKIQEFSVWLERYRAQCTALEDFLQSCPAHRMCDENGEVLYELDDNDLDYWSDGLYSEFLTELAGHRELLNEIKEPKAWLNQNQKSQAIAFIQEQIKKLQTLPELFRVAVGYAFSAIDCYEMLFSIRTQAKELFKRQDFLYEQTSFGALQETAPQTAGLQHYQSQYLSKELCIQPGKCPDYREERRILFRRQYLGSDAETICLRLLPERHEDSVFCRIVLEAQSEHMQNELSNTLQRILQNDGIQAETSAGKIHVRARIMQREEAEQIAAAYVLQTAI